MSVAPKRSSPLACASRSLTESVIRTAAACSTCSTSRSSSCPGIRRRAVRRSSPSPTPGPKTVRPSCAGRSAASSFASHSAISSGSPTLSPSVASSPRWPTGASRPRSRWRNRRCPSPSSRWASSAATSSTTRAMSTCSSFTTATRAKPTGSPARCWPRCRRPRPTASCSGPTPTCVPRAAPARCPARSTATSRGTSGGLATGSSKPSSRPGPPRAISTSASDSSTRAARSCGARCSTPTRSVKCAR